MEGQYEYQRFELDPRLGGGSGFRSGLKGEIERLTQPLGDDAWEIIRIGTHRALGALTPSSYSVQARRAPYGVPAPSSWEYTGFNVFAMPEPEWSNHLVSRGWSRIQEAWYDYAADQWYVFKRTDVWRGTDDGDILNQLETGFGVARITKNWNANLPWRPDVWKTRTEIVTEILRIKWELSSQVGYDVGTYRAVEHWVSESRR